MPTLIYRGHKYEKIAPGILAVTCACGCATEFQLDYRFSDDGAEAKLIDLLDVVECSGEFPCLDSFLAGIAEGGDAV